MLPKFHSILVIGSGSWARAILKILQESGFFETVQWYVRDPGKAKIFLDQWEKKFIKTSQEIRIYNPLDPPLSADVVLHAVPAAFSPRWYADADLGRLRPLCVISAAKGVVPEFRVSALNWLKQQFRAEHFLFLGGPCHSEEVMQSSRSYLTLGCHNIAMARSLASAFTTPYVTVAVSAFPEALEMFGILKNVMAIAVGMAQGLGYGDNFTAILVAAAFREVTKVATEMGMMPGLDVAMGGGFLGDLLVTCFSPHSRNRRLGELLAQGLSSEQALQEIHMVPEGYYILKAWASWLSAPEFPICQTLCRIFDGRNEPAEAFKSLEYQLEK
ncbi:MAG: hypothetical protein NZM15_01775 [Flavobacteriales bacterium]|nr:hypothetical protein [Flavobacteriales bacterium]MDW8431413.1 hypothetical protein [Flavobacteriales bacterium]